MNQFNFCNCNGYNPNCIYCVTYKRKITPSNFQIKQPQKQYTIQNPININKHTDQRINFVNHNNLHYRNSSIDQHRYNNISQHSNITMDNRYKNNYRQDEEYYSDEEETNPESEEDDELPYYNDYSQRSNFSNSEEKKYNTQYNNYSSIDNRSTITSRNNNILSSQSVTGNQHNKLYNQQSWNEDPNHGLKGRTASDIEKERSKMEIDSSNQRYLKSKDKSFIELNTREYDDEDLYDCVEVGDKYKNYNYKKTADELAKERNFLN